MRPTAPYQYLAMALNLAAALALFTGLFLSVFWTPGFLLTAFAAAYASDPRALSHAHAHERRLRDIRLASRRYRGGWLESLARLD